MDKMYIRVYNFERNENGKLQKVQYDYTSTPEQQSRAARDNALLDIELGILRNKQVDEALFNPGSFDEIKKEARIDQILSDTASNGRSLLNIWIDEHELDYKDINSVLKSIFEADLDELKSFVDRFSEKRSLTSIDTFIYNHQQNMAGAALIGMYANNTTGQAKFQTTNLAINDAYTFQLNGREIKSLHDIYSTKNGVTERISKRCAYFSAASVDNVKDSCLRKIGQNTNTAFITGLMLRAGMDVREISLLFNQPFIKYSIDSSGTAPSAKAISKYIEKLNERFGTSVDPKKLTAGLKNYPFTTEELAENIILANRYSKIDDRDIEAMPIGEKTKYVQNNTRALLLFNRIHNLAKQFRGAVGISRADSPNGAISNELHLANKQIDRIDQFMANASKNDWGIDNIQDIMRNGVLSLGDSKEIIRQKLHSENIKVPRLQAFYSLGIDLPMQVISKYFISQSPICQYITKKISSELKYPLSDRDMKVLYNDFTTYILSGTKLFGDSETGTFEEKRDYYLYQYPQKFITLLKNNPQLFASSALNNLRVVNGEIVMEKSGKVTPALRDAVTTGFDSLLFGSDPLGNQIAFDLFMYSYYNEGFIFRHNSFGTFFSAAFLSSFDEVMDTLREVPDSSNMNNFMEQWIAQADNQYKFPLVQEGVEEINDSTISIKNNSVPINTNYLLGENQNTPYMYISYKNNLYTHTGNSETGAIYSKVGLINAGPTLGKLHKFNANASAADITSHNPSEEQVKNLKDFNAASYRQAQSQNRDTEGTYNNVENIEDVELSNADVTDIVDNMDIDAIFDNINMDDLDSIFDSFENVNIDDYNIEDGQQTLKNNGELPLC